MGNKINKIKIMKNNNKKNNNKGMGVEKNRGEQRKKTNKQIQRIKGKKF